MLNPIIVIVMHVKLIFLHLLLKKYIVNNYITTGYSKFLLNNLLYKYYKRNYKIFQFCQYKKKTVVYANINFRNKLIHF